MNNKIVQISDTGNELERNFCVPYPVFEKYKKLLMDFSVGKIELEVKFDRCNCSELNCYQCEQGWEVDKWIPFTNHTMVPPAVNVLKFRKAVSEDQKEKAVKLLGSQGYTFKEGCEWKPPLGKNIFNIKTNITQYLQRVFEETGEGELTPHINYIAAITEDVMEMQRTGLSAAEMKERSSRRLHE